MAYSKTPVYSIPWICAISCGNSVVQKFTFFSNMFFVALSVQPNLRIVEGTTISIFGCFYYFYFYYFFLLLFHLFCFLCLFYWFKINVHDSFFDAILTEAKRTKLKFKSLNNKILKHLKGLLWCNLYVQAEILRCDKCVSLQDVTQLFLCGNRLTWLPLCKLKSSTSAKLGLRFPCVHAIKLQRQQHNSHSSHPLFIY